MVKPLAPVGKQVRCAVALKTFVSVRTYTLLCVSRTQMRQEIYASVHRTHLHTMEVVPCLTRAWRQPRHTSFRDKGGT